MPTVHSLRVFRKMETAILSGQFKPQRIEQSILEQRQMNRAIEQRDRSRLEKLIATYLTFSQNSYLAQLRENGRRKIMADVRRQLS